VFKDPTVGRQLVNLRHRMAKGVGRRETTVAIEPGGRRPGFDDICLCSPGKAAWVLFHTKRGHFTLKIGFTWLIFFLIIVLLFICAYKA
jgi:hypothetical protein